MNAIPLKKISLALAAASLLGATTIQAQTFLSGSYTNSFDLGGNTSSFSGSGSVASWIYWYNTPGGNTPMTCHYGLDADGKTNTSGCLEVDSPFCTNGCNNQNVFFGTFDNQYGYDFNVRANLVLYTNITFKTMVAPGIPPDSTGNFGNIGVGYIDSGYGYHEFGTYTIPGAASNSWVTISVPINLTFPNLSAVPGLAFRIDNYSSYIDFPFTNYIDDLELHLSPVKIPPPTMTDSLSKPIEGLNEIATSPGSGSIYNRYQVVTVDDTGYTFVDNSSVTYSWKILSFPTNTAANFQQHFFIVNGAPGQYDQAADYNLADCIFITVQQQTNGTAVMDFRYKTNEPAGNGMLFNGTSPTNTASNPNGWPIQPFCSLNPAVGPLGTWSVTFANTTNVTLTAPDGTTTNFVLDAASAALFADPVTLILGGQPNNVNGDGQAVVYGSFSATGCASPYSENFATEDELNTNFWKDLSSDTNGDVFVPPGSAYWLSWTIPDAGFSLQDATSINAATNWADISPLTIQNNGKRQALLAQSELPAGNTAFFRLIERTFTQLQVLMPGETNAPNTPTGKIGTPTAAAVNSEVDVVINAVDSTFHILGSGDSLALTTTDNTATITTPNPTLVGGTVTVPFYFGQAGSFTVTATDTTETNIIEGTSSPITVQ
ncbi:MAG: hypothetical protein ABSH48_09535 [Verrucomicrobiota bacterium]|jgi:hypothetical protein